MPKFTSVVEDQHMLITNYPIDFNYHEQEIFQVESSISLCAKETNAFLRSGKLDSVAFS